MKGGGGVRGRSEGNEGGEREEKGGGEREEKGGKGKGREEGEGKGGRFKKRTYKFLRSTNTSVRNGSAMEGCTTKQKMIIKKTAILT